MQLSWTANGRELVYLGYWTCATSKGCVKGGPFGDYEAVRTLNPAGRGGTLTSGRQLLHSDGYLGAAAISPDGSVVTAVRQPQQHGRTRQRMIRHPVRRADRPAASRPLLDNHQQRRLHAVLRAGPAGRNLITVGSGWLRGPVAGTFNGWIADGRLHRLAPPGSDVSSETW